MSANKKSSRRRFLRNSALAAMAIGAVPQNASAAETPKAAETGANCPATTEDYYGQGPFYRPNAPAIPAQMLAKSDEPGERLVLSGVVRTLDCSKVIPDTVIDVWHANDAGQYDKTGFNLRGVTKSNKQGFYIFETILPGKYLNGASFRPRHIHFRIKPPDFPMLTTQLYFESDTSISEDEAASITSGDFDATHRIIALKKDAQGKWQGNWDIVLNGDGIIGTKDLHLNKGMVYSASPNPFSDQIEIKYGIYQTARVRIEIFDASGAKKAVVVDETKTPDKYSCIWSPQTDLPAGYYWATLKLNDLQVHYLKIVKI